MMPFSDIHISQCSVATCLKRGGIFKYEFVANILPSPLVKKIENRIIVGEVMAKSLVSCFFDSGCIMCRIVSMQPFDRRQGLLQESRSLPYREIVSRSRLSRTATVIFRPVWLISASVSHSAVLPTHGRPYFWLSAVIFIASDSRQYSGELLPRSAKRSLFADAPGP